MSNVIANGIDCYSPLTQSHASTLKQNSVLVACRYIGAHIMGWSKGLTPAEVTMLHKTGIHIVLNWEGNPTYASYFTYAQGLRDAHNAVAECAWLGVPNIADIAIYFSVDFDAQPEHLAAIEQYFRGVRAGIGRHSVGVYGSFRVIEYMAASKIARPDHFWQTLAWSGGQVSAHTHIYQSECNVNRYELNVDVDDVYAAPGWWESPHVVAPKPVAVQHYQITVPNFTDVQRATQVALQITQQFDVQASVTNQN